MMRQVVGKLGVEEGEAIEARGVSIRTDPTCDTGYAVESVSSELNINRYSSSSFPCGACS